MFLGNANRNAIGGSIQRMNNSMSGGTSWNRGSMPQTPAAVGNKMPPGYASNPMSGAQGPAYPSMNRGVMRGNSVAGMNGPTGAMQRGAQMQGQLLGRAHSQVTNTNQPSSMQPQNMGTFRQQQIPFSPPTMMGSNGGHGTNNVMAPNFPTGPTDGFGEGLDHSFPHSQTSNVDFNFLNDVIGGN